MWIRLRRNDTQAQCLSKHFNKRRKSHRVIQHISSPAKLYNHIPTLFSLANKFTNTGKNDIIMPRAQNIGSEDPGIDIPLPTPLNKHLMKELNLIDNRHPKPIHQYFRAWYGLNQRDEKVPAQRSHARGFLHHQKAWIEIMCRGGLVLWWQPFRNLVRYEMPTGLQPKRDRSCYVVTGYGGVSKRYHKHSRRILPPVPVLNSGNVTFQMFSTMLASCP